MIWDQQTVERIVLDVIEQLRNGEPRSQPETVQPAPAVSAVPLSTNAVSLAQNDSNASRSIVLTEKVVTAELLAERLNGKQAVAIGTHAILTPSAKDFLRSRGVAWSREATAAKQISGSPGRSTARAARWRVIVSTSTKNVTAAIDALRQRSALIDSELAGSAREAARQAVSVLARGEADGVVLLTSETHSAACLANRNVDVRGAEISDTRAVAAARSQLGANLLCVDPSAKSFFELRQLLQECTAGGPPQAPLDWLD